MNRTDLQTLARLRLTEAKVLLRAGQHAGAYYLAGYVIECALKACVAKQVAHRPFIWRDREACTRGSRASCAGSANPA
jgi:HEPN domain-containing protein